MVAVLHGSRSFMARCSRNSCSQIGGGTGDGSNKGRVLLTPPNSPRGTYTYRDSWAPQCGWLHALLPSQENLKRLASQQASPVSGVEKRLAAHQCGIGVSHDARYLLWSAFLRATKTLKYANSARKNAALHPLQSSVSRKRRWLTSSDPSISRQESFTTSKFTFNTPFD